MDIVSLAAWGEFLGGIAVVVSLIYLAGQVRQNSRLLRNSTTATMGAADLALGSLLAADPKLSAIVNGGLEDPASLSADDRHRFNVVMDMMMRAFLRSQVFAQGGGMEASIWQTEVRSYGGMMQSPGGQAWWSENRSMFSDDFGAFLDGLIASAPIVDDGVFLASTASSDAAQQSAAADSAQAK